MKKAFDQTVRDLKRGVNKKVLKVPSIEQKVLDATSNERWGPHGTLLADIALASRNYHEFQMIMSILWKRMNDTGKNWRHVYKALTVLEHMVAHGSERVIEEIREHAYQIQTLANFQYTDSSGIDQGNNVRKKSQNLVVLVNDKERIHEVRRKAAANREKFQNSSAGNMYQSRSRSIDGERHDDQAKDRDRGYEDDGQYSSRDSGSRDEEQSQGRSKPGHKINRSYSEQNLGAPPSYGEAVEGVKAVKYAHSPNHSDRDGEISAAASRPCSPSASSSPAQVTGTAATTPTPRSSAAPALNINDDGFDPRGSFPASTTSKGVAETMTGNGEMDLFASLPDNSLALVPTTSLSSTNEVDTSTNFSSRAHNRGFDDPFGDGPFKAIPSTDGTQSQQQSFHSLPSFPNSSNSGPELPQQVSQSSAVVTFHGTTSTSSGDTNIDLLLADILPLSGHQHPVSLQPEYPATNKQDIAQSLPQSGQNISSTFSSPSDLQAHPNGFPSQSGQMTSLPDRPSPHTSFSPSTHQTSSPVQSGHPSSLNGFPAQSGQLVMHPNFASQFGQPAPQAGFSAHNGQFSSLTAYPNQSAPQALSGFSAQTGQPASVGLLSPEPSGHFVQPYGGPSGNYNMQSGGQNMVPEVSSAATSQPNATNFLVSPQPFQAPHVGSSSLMASQPGFPSTTMISSAPPAKDKFETKSTVWTDTLSRGLVNLNISGPKTNPLSDIGVDFDALNRKEKRMEKPPATPVISTVHMGKAMGSGSRIGQADAGNQRPMSNPMMGAGSGAGAGMGMGMAGPRPGASMAGYGGMNQQPMGGRMEMNMAPNMGMGTQMQRPMGFPPGSTMAGGYNSMMGTGNYGHNPYGGGYR
ncbi:hypothetical protein Leryth_001817 [Lithospermum erythrorhizon]|nr:hypothetical protein Leryth_001817 [Lithospermum erythrorhizon]